jgi:hypothetical protein
MMSERGDKRLLLDTVAKLQFSQSVRITILMKWGLFIYHRRLVDECFLLTALGLKIAGDNSDELFSASS